MSGISSRTSPSYTTILIPPPGPCIAPNGFPADPLPSTASTHLRDSLKVRIQVFCEEQKCSLSEELDQDDPRSWSWGTYYNEPGSSASVPVATIRLVPPPHAPHPNGYFDSEEEPYIKLGRLATLISQRGKGLGRGLVQTALKWAGEHPKKVGEGWKGMVLLHAQTSVEELYTKMGFVTDHKMGVWDEEGIKHVGMWKRVEIVKVAYSSP